MPEENRNKRNQPQVEEAKRKSPHTGRENKTVKRSETAQVAPNRPEGDYGAIAEEEGASQA